MPGACRFNSLRDGEAPLSLGPLRWHGEEALAAVRAWREIGAANGEVRGERMAEEIHASPDRWPLDEILDAPDVGEVDDIPFRLAGPRQRGRSLAQG